ncbi:MAG: choline dehydrogenase [Gaiellales bacterium]|nr:choline dehydrogenase [Gaiellales bacterium]
MIEAFAAHLPVRIRFGEGVTELIPELVAGRRALALVEQPVLEIPAVAAAVEGLDVLCKPPGEPTFATVDQAAQRVLEARPEVIVAIGGGSALDLAKAARLAAGQGEPFRRFVAGEIAVRPPQVDLITVPTTSGTGSEVSGGAVVTDNEAGRKLGAAHPLMRAQDALVDPLLTLGLPSEATAWTGADALAQAIGAVIVSNSNVLSVAVGLESCRQIAAGLAAAVADGGNRVARAEMSLGSLLAGLAMNLSDSAADHALGHSIGATLELPHGLTVGLMLAETLEVNRPQCGDRLERVADALGEREDGSGDGSRAIRAVRRLLAEIGLPTLREVGVEESHLDRLVELSLADYCLTVNPRVWSEADVRMAYVEALSLQRR